MACPKDPLRSLTRSSVTDGTTTTDSPSSFMRMAAHTCAMRCWMTSYFS